MVITLNRMGSTFHIVEKNGRIELVHLDRVKINSKTNRDHIDTNNKRIPTESCTCVMCYLPVIETKTANISENAPAESRVVKNYLKGKRKHITASNRPESTNPDTNGTILSTIHDTNGTILSTIHDKSNDEQNGTSAESDAMISIKTEPELEIIDVDITSNEPESDIVDEISAANTVLKESNAPSEDYETKKTEANGKTSTLQFQIKKIKCNICEMVFPVNIRQKPAMKTHFLLHKNSVKSTFTCKICHRTWPCMDYLMIIQHKKTHEKTKNFSSDNRSCLVKPYAPTGEKLRRSGSIEFKQIHSTNSKVEILNDEAADSDDDIQIVEKKPELIVIDDNDEDIMVKNPQKKGKFYFKTIDDK